AREFDLANRPRSSHRRADRRADETGLRDWRVAHPLRAELVDQPLGRAERAEHDVLAHQEGQRIAFHLLRDCLVNRLDKTDLRHDDTSAPLTLSKNQAYTSSVTS